MLNLKLVEIQPEGYRMLVALLSVAESIEDFDKKLLVDAALRVPTLERLFLVEVDLDDNAFDGLAEIRKPLALRHLRLQKNNVSLKTLGAICRASSDGVLNLERLDLDMNNEIRDPAIHALAPMLDSPVAGSATRLTRLDLKACNFGLEGVTCLLLALGHNKTVKHLDLSNNRFGDGFGDVLAHFLEVNSSITYLDIDNVQLELLVYLKHC
ncbi:hypothetical protein PsorP6_005107 [Peronosclerospora sorghi]|uniref:Uncharacterized protein n=1 Tax=Peronosclerospora sorghi TaxID=230839 RepID=A0ACC0W445_9STRA|nr:hypothetical protein PsorP6_005107 [Peronosclerospora sorghi]